MKLMAVILILILIVPMLAACGNTQQEANPRQEISPAQEGAEPESETLAFFKSLDYSDGMNVVKAIFDRWPLQYGTTLGLNGAPQIRPIEFKFSSQALYLSAFIAVPTLKLVSLSLAFSLMGKNKGNFFSRRLLPYPAGGPRSVWLPSLRGRRCSLWYSHRRDLTAPAHLSVPRRSPAGCL